ncbi:MAG: DNA gyrase subunit A [Dehalococcoidia bacterium]|nr:MAG: DNA gyrase subunit A [Dehalococcoidia bacterium]
MEIGTIKPVKIEDEVRVSYLDYAMSVIVSRALPDVRDGLKPVHRRILYAMNELGLRHTSPYKKSARIVGEVLGKYHPHGDAPVYESLVRMAQDFSMRYVLVEGQGNFGSLDNDPPAAMRYTEARLAEIAQEMLIDIDKDTVDFAPNFDDTLKEPVVLSSRLPNLLVNGSSGIAVGMATNIPPHNLSEVCHAITFLIDNPEATTDELIEFVPGPDFPTGGIILGREETQRAYTTGQGKVVIRGKAQIEEPTKGRHQIVITELPYQTNKAELVQRIANLVKEKRIEGISELRDESDRQGMRIVVELKTEAQPEQVLNNLYKHTALQSTFFVNMLALVDRQPRVISLKEALRYYIDFRHQLVVRRSQFELRQAKERAHILEGLKLALDQLDQVITIIRRSRSAEVARNELVHNFGLSTIQAQAILDMQLRRLAALERQKILEEYTQVIKTIAYLEDLLANPKKILFLIKEETQELKSKYGDARKTQISEQEVAEFSEEDLIPHQEMVVTLSTRGYIKRVPSDTYKLQHRGGKGVSGMLTKEVDSASLFLLADTHDTLLFFSSRGRVFSIKCHRIPQDTSRTAKGTPLINLLPLDPQEQITAVVAADFASGNFLVLATAKGKIKRTAIEQFASIKSRGLIAISLAAEDELVAAGLANEKGEVALVTEEGKLSKFRVDSFKAVSRTAAGVRGIKLSPDDKVVSMEVVYPGACLLTVTSRGFGKLSPISAYPIQQRSRKGVQTHNVGEKAGRVVATKLTSPSEELMLISDQGIIIRVPMKSVPIQGRSTRGISLMRLAPQDEVISIACLKGKE